MKLPRNKDYALVVTGWLQAREDGYYTFYFRNQRGAKLYVGDQLLIQYDEKTPISAFSYILPLAKGFYPVRVEYVNKQDRPIEMPYLPYYIAPGAADPSDANPIPADVECHQ